MRIFLLLFIIYSSAQVFGQPGVSKLIEVNGEKYYQHKVMPGNTLWGLQQMYSVPAEKILKDNPVLADGLKEGQVILITAIVNPSNSGKITSEYRVKNKETLYGLSRKFNTSVDELIALNPELANGLNKGQIILVPGTVNDDEELIKENKIESTTTNPFVVDTIEVDGHQKEITLSFSDSTIKHVVMAHETMYSISKRFMVPISDLMALNGLKSTSVKEGQIIIIPVKNERVDKVRIKSVSDRYDPANQEPLVFDVKDQYNVAILLPFHLDYGAGYSEYMSNLSAQFYMGSLLALDSLEKMGLNAKIHVFDTKNDTNEVNKILSKAVFSDVDLIIGPLLSKSMEQVARFCRLHKIRMVCPVESDASLLKENRLIYASVSSNISLMEGLAEHMLNNNAKDNIVLIKPLDTNSLPMFEAFRKSFNEAPYTGTRPHLTESTTEEFSTYIKRGVNTLFVVPSNDRSTAIKFMNNLNRSAFKSKTEDLFVYGTKNWANFEDINNVYKNKYNFRFPSSNFMDYYSEEMINLNRKYRTRFKTDLSKMAAQAYDITMFFCSDFFLGNDSPGLVMNNFDMKQVSDADGYENANIFIIEQGDFELFNSQLRTPER